MEKEKPLSKYGQGIIAVMLVAYLSTSFDLRYFSFQSPVVTVGEKKIHTQALIQRMREEKAYAKLQLNHAHTPKKSDLYWIQKVVMDEVWDQEAKAMGILVSENRARQSLREKMCFLDDSGELNVSRLIHFYKKNPIFFRFDLQSMDEDGAFLMSDGMSATLYRGNSEYLEPEDRFDDGKMAAFLRKNNISLLQMIAIEKRTMRRNMLKNALAKNVFLPTMLKDMALKGQKQQRVWRSKFFPLQDSDIAGQNVEQKNVELYLHNSMPISLKSSPEMRTFTVMLTPNFSTLSPSSDASQEQTMIEDAIGSGKMLSDVAKEKGWPFLTLTSSSSAQAMDFSPLSWNAPEKKGIKLSEKPLNVSQDMRQKILERVFAGTEGLYHLPAMPGGMMWVHVHGIESARPLNPKELYAAAEYALKVKQSKIALKQKALAFEKSMTTGTPAKNIKNHMITHSAYARDAVEKEIPAGLSHQAMMQAFHMTPPPTTRIIEVPGGYEIIALTSVSSEKSSNPTKNHTQDIDQDQALERQWKIAFLHAYEMNLRKKHRIQWNDKAMLDSFGAELLNNQENIPGDDPEEE